MKIELVTTLKNKQRIYCQICMPRKITEHGKPSAYLLDVNSYEFIQNRMQILEGIARGERAILEKHTFSQTEAKRKMKKCKDFQQHPYSVRLLPY